MCRRKGADARETRGESAKIALGAPKFFRLGKQAPGKVGGGPTSVRSATTVARRAGPRSRAVGSTVPMSLRSTTAPPRAPTVARGAFVASTSRGVVAEEPLGSSRRSRACRPPARTSRGPAPLRAGRRSKGGPSSSYVETWDGSKYDMGQMGMWDVEGIEGPSCIRLPPLDLATRDDLERVYLQAKNTYFSGQPVVDDQMFDEIERRLRYLGSDVARKYPRCSRRDMRIYSDAEPDEAQMDALAWTWLSFAALGALLIALDVRDAIADSSFSAAATAMATRRPPVFAVVGAFLARSGWEKYAKLREGTTVAVTGDCPNCAERVYAFVPANKPEVRVKSECHVCERGVVFHAKVAKSDASRWGRVATGRIYLVSRTEDYYDKGDGSEASAWPPTKREADR